MKVHNILGFGIVFSLVLYSCNTQKNTFVNRNVNTLKAKYNVLYNGQVAFDKGLQAISEKHEDNFWKRLEIEPITFDESEIVVPKFNSPGHGFDDDSENKTKKPSTPFDRAEDKAVKSIQKYSMNIEGYEKNSNIDDAYLLLGKSRYYTQRFIPAIEAYNYIIANYPKADLHYETRVWRAKANVRLGNEDMAIETMNLLLEILDEKEKVSKRVQEEAYTAMAIAYAETDTIQKVIEHLTNATKTFINKEQSSRNLFVLGQIYSELNRKDSARMVFQKLADKKQASDKYRIHANIELVKNSEGDSTTTALIKRFKKLIRNSDNRKYLDELYYHVGVLEENRDSLTKAEEYYNKSLTTANGSDYQKTYTYDRLGALNFNKQNYSLAGAYYDSVLQLSPKKFDEEKRIRRIRRKNKGLTTLRKHEALIKNNDSILSLVAMTPEERITFFEKHIEKLKKADEERKQQLLNAQNNGGLASNGLFGNSKNAGKWYFYSSQSKTFGKGEFKRLWGNRTLNDNWRWSDNTVISQEQLVEEEKENQVKYNLATYIEAIPVNNDSINQLKTNRNKSLYDLGIIYKEQFKNTNLAVKNLELLKISNTDSSLDLPINYHLYQLYTLKKDVKNADIAKNYIFDKHPNSKFAAIIKSPNKKLEVTDKIDDEGYKKYKELYYLYKADKYDKVIEGVDNSLQSINNSKLIPKLALLKALAIGKYKSVDEYKRELEYVAVSYANLEEGKKAQQIINLLQNPKKNP